MRPFVFALLIILAGRAEADAINVLTDLLSPFPPGCVALELPQQPASADNLLYDEEVLAPSINSGIRDARVRVTIWRMGCHEPGFSIVLVRLRKVSEDEPPVLVPQIFAQAGTVDIPQHPGQLIGNPAVGNVGATGNVIPLEGRTYMLGVDQLPALGDSLFFPEDYNDLFTLELNWESLVAAGSGAFELFDIPPYVPSLDPPQFEAPILHGRMSGQYTFDGIPATGLQLIVGEQTDDTNFIFAIFFTYMNGQPYWLVGNTGGEAPGFPNIELGMIRFTGGEFIAAGPGSFELDDLAQDVVGSIFIEPIDCTTILVGYDFTPLGMGTGVLEGRRDLFRIAGYDCNPWQ